MGKLFGTDGIRGVANIYPMTSEMALRVGRALAYISRQGKRRHRILIGKDTRLSGYMLETALASGICSMGVDVLLVGPLSTPGIAHLTRTMRADAGVVISASHNPFADNGIKIFSADGFKLPDKQEELLEELILGDKLDKLRPTAHAVGKAFRIEDAVGRYVVALKYCFPPELSLNGVRIVVDCANGAAYRVAPSVFEELGAKVIALGVKPDGYNINRGCGSLYPEMMCQAVLRYHADLGIALDGDADRVVMATEKGELLDGDHLLAISARFMLSRRTLRKRTVVATVMSNLGLEHALAQMGVKLVRTPVGDRYVVERMRQGNYNLGGEQSGHLIFLDHSTTGDGVLTALMVLAVALREDQPLSELAKIMQPVPQVTLSVKVREKVPFEQIKGLNKRIAELEKKLAGQGRVLIRYSGTEPKVRIMLEGPDKSKIKRWAEELAEIFMCQVGEEK